MSKKLCFGLQMMTLDSNPFTSDASSKSIKTSVCSLELTSDGEGTVNVSGLDNDIEINIPISPGYLESDEPKGSFLKPNQMTIHSYYAELANAPVSLTMAFQDKDEIVDILIRFGSRPTVNEFDQNFTVTYQTNVTQGNAFQIDTESPISITVMPPEPTVIYVGLLSLGEKNISEHSRKRRSCFGRGRQRRSCVGVKDPPPNGFNKTVFPQYDPSTDINYSLTISQSICLYWSTTKEKWTSEGCKVI